MPRAVLDANVFVSAAIRPEGPPGQVITRLLDASFGLVLSPPIVDEVLRALAYPKVLRYLRPGLDPTLWFEDLVALSDMVSGDHAVRRVSADPDDDKYVAAAVEGRATFLVSGDPHLLDVGEYEGVRIVSPRDFLRVLDASKDRQ